MKKLKMTETQKKEHLRKLNLARVQRYRKTHKSETREFQASVPTELYLEITQKLEEDGITKRKFVEDAICAYLNKKDEE